MKKAVVEVRYCHGLPWNGWPILKREYSLSSETNNGLISKAMRKIEIEKDCIAVNAKIRRTL